MSVRAQYLLDTNVLSETRRKKPHPGLLAFLTRTESSAIYTSVLVLGELRKGVAARRRADASSALQLSSWVDGLEFGFSDRVFGVDAAIARLWGELAAERPRPVIDTLLAATALVHQLTLVTRNVADVRDIPQLSFYDPWSG
jgi:toxin FitB